MNAVTETATETATVTADATVIKAGRPAADLKEILAAYKRDPESVSAHYKKRLAQAGMIEVASQGRPAADLKEILAAYKRDPESVSYWNLNRLVKAGKIPALKRGKEATDIKEILVRFANNAESVSAHFIKKLTTAGYVEIVGETKNTRGPASPVYGLTKKGRAYLNLARAAITRKNAASAATTETEKAETVEESIAA